MVSPLSAIASLPLSSSSAALAVAGSGSSTSSSPASSGSAASRDGIGKEAFLRLLVTQLRNQDPTSPLQPHEFAAQLAQFTSVEQLSQLNTGLAALGDQTQFNTMLSETAFSASLVGKDIVAQGNKLAVTNSNPGRARIDVGLGGGVGTLTLKSPDGSLRKVELGHLVAGVQAIELPADIPPGSYTYSVQVTGANNSDVAVRTFTVGRVDGVHFANGRITLRIGAIEVELGELSEIGAP